MQEVNLPSPKRLGHCRRHLPATLRYLEQIRQVVLVDRKRAFLDMSGCEHISPAGCIMLAAEVDRCVTARRGSVNGQDPLAEKPRMTMARFGFHEHLHFRRPRLSKQPKSALRIHSGVGKPQDEGPALTLVSTMAFDLFGDTQFKKRVYGALEEAVTNVGNHAFDEKYAPQVPFVDGRWWLAGVAHSKKDGAWFYVLDHGPGVPTVAINKMREAVLAYWQLNPESCKSPPSSPADHEILEAAAEARRCGVETGDGGRGFQAMIRLIDEWADAGSVQVISGKGAYIFRRSRPGSNSPPRCLPLVRGFPGTLIVWKVTKPRTTTTTTMGMAK